MVCFVGVLFYKIFPCFYLGLDWKLFGKTFATFLFLVFYIESNIGKSHNALESKE